MVAWFFFTNLSKIGIVLQRWIFYIRLAMDKPYKGPSPLLLNEIIKITTDTFL